MARRGQAAMEFLMTYGWAILAVLVMIGALAYFGVLSPSRFTPEKCIFSPGVRCSDFQATQGPDASTATATLSVVLSNSLSQSVTITTVTAGTTPIACSGLTGTWDSEETVTVVCQNIATGSSNGGNAGAQVKIPITITYTTIGGTYPKTVTGEVTTKVV